MKLFNALQTYDLLIDFVTFFDWLFDDKFNKEIWNNKNKIKSFSEKIRKFEGLSDSTFQVTTQKKLKFPTKNSFHKLEPPVIFYTEGQSMGRDWVRHLRNGIAHGLNQVVVIKGEKYIEILDYSDESHNNQTAYFFIPLHFLLETHKKYMELEIRFTKENLKKRVKVECFNKSIV